MPNPLIAASARVSNLISGLRPTDVSPEIIKIAPEETTLTTLLMALGKVKVDDFIFKINEQENQPSSVTVVSEDHTTPTASEITLDTDQGKNVREGMTLRLSDTASWYVTSVAGDVVTVDSDTTGLVEDDVLLLGAPAEKEFSDAPAPATWQPEQREGYCQTTRFAWGHSRWTKLVKTYLRETRVVADRATAYAEMKRMIERGLLFNTKKLISSPLRYVAGGLFDQNTTNVTTFAANSVSWPKISNNLIDQGIYNGSLLWLLTSRTGQAIIDQVNFKKWNGHNATQSNALGISAQDIICGDKKIKVMTSNQFKGQFVNMGVLIDPKLIEIVTTVDQDTGKRQWMLEESDAQTPGQDGTINVLTCDWGLRLKSLPSHAVWKGINTVE